MIFYMLFFRLYNIQRYAHSLDTLTLRVPLKLKILLALALEVEAENISISFRGRN